MFESLKNTLIYLEQISKFKDWVFESRSGPVC